MTTAHYKHQTIFHTKTGYYWLGNLYRTLLEATDAIDLSVRK